MYSPSPRIYLATTAAIETSTFYLFCPRTIIRHKIHFTISNDLYKTFTKKNIFKWYFKGGRFRAKISFIFFFCVPKSIKFMTMFTGFRLISHWNSERILSAEPRRLEQVKTRYGFIVFTWSYKGKDHTKRGCVYQVGVLSLLYGFTREKMLQSF